MNLVSRALRNHLVAFVLLALVIISCQREANAFDTGHHQDMTREAFQDEGFDPDADTIRIAMIENWLVDYYSARPDLGDSNARQIFAELGYLHFDNLTSTEQVQNYWNALAINTKQQVRQAALAIKNASSFAERRRRLIRMISLIGITLHPVQDFYSHSNWAEIYPMINGKYRSNTWFDTTLSGASVHTGLTTPSNPSPTGDNAKDHGSYEGGMNHDSHDRPSWAPAYIFAYSASRQWLRAAQTWADEVDPVVWQQVRSFHLTGPDKQDLLSDLDASRRISEWVSFAGKDGTWKGMGSGSKVEFVIDAVHWITGRMSIFVKQIYDDHLYRPLMSGLDNPGTSMGSPPAFPHLTLAKRAVEIKTVTVSAIDNPDNTPLPDPIDDKADYYSMITVLGQPYIDSMQYNRNELIPRWRTLKLVPAELQFIPIQYALIDEDGHLSGGDDYCDINPAGHKVVLDFALGVSNHSLSGDINGIHDNLCNAAESAGGDPDNDAARVRFYVTETPILESTGIR
jgi:hypothetical protein